MAGKRWEGRGGYGFAMTTTTIEGSAEDGTVRQHPQHLQQQPVQQHPQQLQHQPVGSSDTWSEADDLVVLQTFVGMVSRVRMCVDITMTVWTDKG